ncbi:MAG: zinc-dependent peptidase [Comamonadaceae bacterium]|nr:zinc-dependent peptidase [Rubrivivax sp.]NLZ41719.1 zinc-dependent peptidase [Comamonadaceae bacterium]
MLARWWRGWQVRRDDAAAARRAVPDDLWRRTLVRYPFLRRRDRADEAALRRLASLFLDRKEFHAAGGLRLDNAMVVAIAAQAVLPVLRLGLARYDGFVGIVVHPDQVVARREVADDDGLVHEYDEVLVGEAMAGGPLMLSWRDVRGAGRSAAQGCNVVIHEFAHVLDLADGAADGVPLLPSGLTRKAWLAVLEPDYERFCARTERGEETALDPYGASAIDEFFAVASEAFFVAPQAMRSEHAALYALFVRYYGQDPEQDSAPQRGR